MGVQAICYPAINVVCFSDGITVQIMSQVPCIVLPLWGVNIAKIYNVIHSPWQEFREGFVDGLLHPLLEGHVLHTQTPIIIQYPLYTFIEFYAKFFLKVVDQQCPYYFHIP